MDRNVATRREDLLCYSYDATPDMPEVLPGAVHSSSGGHAAGGPVRAGRLPAGSRHLIPAPEARRTMLTIFDDLTQAGSAVTAIIRSRVIPATLEIMDQVTIRTYDRIGGRRVGSATVELTQHYNRA
jgi:hypothetical protein